MIGRDFDVELLLQVTEDSDDELLELLEQAVAASVLIESASVPGRFSFAHALINHTLYEDLGTTRRARLHRRIARGAGGAVGWRAGSARLGARLPLGEGDAAVDLPKAISYARLAGERALDELGPDEALRWFQQALELQGQQSEVDPAERCDILIGLGEAQRQVGEAAFRETLLEASSLASELGDADRAARAALANNRGVQSIFGEVDEERFAALERALELDGFANPARCARLMSLQALELQLGPHHERRRALVDKALALARDAGDPRALANVLRNSMVALTGAGHASSSCARGRRGASTTAKEVRDPALRVLGGGFRGQRCKALRGELEPGEGNYGRARTLADDARTAQSEVVRPLHSACEALLRGDLAEAERFAEEALQAGGGAGQPDALMVYSARSLRSGSIRAAAEEIVETGRGRASRPTRRNSAVWRGGLAWAYCWLGRTAEGRDRGGGGKRSVRPRLLGPNPPDRARALCRRRFARRTSRMPPPSSTS